MLGRRPGRGQSRERAARRALALAPLLVLLAAGCAARPAPVVERSGACGGAAEVIVRHAGSGEVAIAVYDSARAWDGGEPRSKRRVELVEGVAHWCVPALPAGRYAVKAYLDRDGDGALGRGAFGRPTEPYGFSSGARGAFGPPSFDDASFELRVGATTTVAIELD